MGEYFCRYKYAWVGSKKKGNVVYHRVVADSRQEAIQKMIKGTTIPASMVYVAKRRPKQFAGRRG